MARFLSVCSRLPVDNKKQKIEQRPSLPLPDLWSSADLLFPKPT
jgi:hypothetical protein